jgi:hypothetical protein
MSISAAMFFSSGFEAWMTTVREAALDWWLIPPALFVGWIIALLLQRSTTANDDKTSHATPVIPPYKSVLPRFQSELNRVRRYDRSLALIVLKLAEAHALGPLHGSEGTSLGEAAASAAQRRAILRVMFWNVGYALRDLLRESDLPTCDISEMRYVVLLPEADQQEAMKMAERLARQVLEHVDVPIRTGVAAYRVDGLTIDDLVLSATAKCEELVVDYPQRHRAGPRAAILRVADPGS